MVPSNILFAVVIAHVLTGVASVANRYLVSFLDATEIAFLRYLFGALLVLCIFMVERPAKPNRPYTLNSILLGIIFFALFPYLFAASFEHISAARGALLIATMSIWAMIINQITGRESANRYSLLSVVLTIFGLGLALSSKLIEGGFDWGNLTGELIMIFAAIVGAIYSVLARLAFEGVPTSSHTLIGMTAGFIALAPFAIQQDVISDLLQFDSRLWLIIILFGCFTGGLAFYLFNWVLKRTSATFVTLFVPLNPLVAMVLGWWLLNETLDTNFIIGALIVIAGLFIASMRPVK